MDINRVLQMLLRMLFRPLMRMGIDYAARRGKSQAEMTPEEKDQARKAKDLARRADEAARLTRRLGR